MARPSTPREIQVQRPAQSLAHFQTKLGQNKEEDAGLLKPILIGAAGLLGIALVVTGWVAWQNNRMEKHEAQVAALQLTVEGDGITPVAPAEVEQRMRANLGRLEALAASAPKAQRGSTEGLLTSWRLALDGKEAAPAPGTDPWSRVRLAERAIALGQAGEARAQLDPLRAKALPDEPWAEAFWSALLDTDRLAGDRAQAVKDLADYKARYKGRGDVSQMDALLKSI